MVFYVIFSLIFLFLIMRTYLINHIIGPVDKEEGPILSHSILFMNCTCPSLNVHENQRSNRSLIIALTLKKEVQIYGNIVLVIIQK